MTAAAASSPPKPIDWGWSSSKAAPQPNSPAPSSSSSSLNNNNNNNSISISNGNGNGNGNSNGNSSFRCLDLAPNCSDGGYIDASSAAISAISAAPIVELQFLPPAAASCPASSQILAPIGIISRDLSSSSSPLSSSSAAARLTTSWTIDPSRLKHLMMAGSMPPPPPPPPPSSCSFPSSNGYGSAPVATESHRQDLAAAAAAAPTFFDIPGSAHYNKPLPSGWERCLDLKSGEIYVKKVDGTANMKRVSKQTQQYTHHQAMKDRSRVLRESFSHMNNGQKQDWSQGWHQGRHGNTSIGSGMGFYDCEREMAGSLDREPLSLDLDLRLTNERRTRVSSSSSELMASSPQSWNYGNCHPRTSCNGVYYSPQSTIREWKWRKLGSDVICSDKPSNSIEEIVGGSTMATAICSQCLKYVLMKKSNPTCPRCSNPVILDSSSNGTVMNAAASLLPPVSKKRPNSLELSPDDLSLSTDSSR